MPEPADFVLADAFIRLAALDDLQLTLLCRLNFPAVAAGFGEDTPRDQKVLLLLGYCSRQAAAGEMQRLGRALDALFPQPPAADAPASAAPPPQAAVPGLGMPSSAVADVAAAAPVTAPTAPPPDPLDGLARLLALGRLPEPGPPLPGWRLPLGRSAVFTGRAAELLALATDLFAGGRTAAISGAGGSGKTLLAVELCCRLGRFTHGVHWLDAGGTPQENSLAFEIAACGRALGLQPWPEKQPEQVQATLDAWRRDPERLLVLDGLDDPALLAAWLPRFAGARLLVTTRLAALSRALGLALHRLSILPRLDSLALLRRLAPALAGVPAAQLDPLAARLYDLPLALHLAGCALDALPGLTPAAYLAELESAGGLLAHNPLPEALLDSPTGHIASLYATFLTSWLRLDEAVRTDAAAMRLFLACGWCTAGPAIPLELLGASLTPNPSPGGGGESAPPLPPGDRPGVRAGLARLLQLGLLDSVPGGGVRIHPLLAEFARQLNRDDPGDSPLAALAIAAGDLAYNLNDSGLPADFAPLRPHLAPVAAAIRAADPLLAAAIWNELGYACEAAGDYPAARPAYEAALAIYRSELGDDDPVTAASLNNLALLLQAQGDLAGARPLFEQALAVKRRIYDPGDPAVALGLNNLAALLQAQGELAAARPLFEEALRIDRRAYGAEHPDVASDLNNLAVLLCDLGDDAAARPLLEEALAARRAALGDGHPDTADSLNNLGLLLQRQGDLAAARSLLEEALAARRAALGEAHPDTAQSLNSLAGLLEAQGDLPAARLLYEQALAARRAALGAAHPLTAASLNNLAELLRQQGDYAAARPLYEQAIAIWRAALGEQHPTTAIGLTNLGLLLQAQGDPAAARALYAQALAIYQQRLPPGHPQIAALQQLLSGLPPEG